ncbi:hypothetical protein AK88_03047 [Plasmodium fragile]|uniref:Uncharacterized protein n=1 Tax=Plasmodium fragile TaxID=5857 RepID=A0A0D9QJL3_PLAFR|nr:uncharacterized protein AK88_03047 [Plasmodium fragile]KJP87250.1 hypothetical protein AK88_03047 [Plasmodium fragile]
MCIRISKVTGLNEKIRGSLFRRKISGPTPLYKTPLRYIWFIFFYIDIFLLYVFTFSYFFSIILRQECFETFSVLFLTAANLVSSFIIDFFFMLIKGEDIVSEDEIIVSTCLTITLCIIKVATNACTFYFSLITSEQIIDSTVVHMKQRCHTSAAKWLLLNCIIINSFSFLETYIETILTLFSIIHFKRQVQNYETIV